MDTLLSSPDPLNDSPTFYSPRKPVKSRRTSRARQSFPLECSSPKKQTFELDVGNELSPQKIKVTVEAGDSDAENASQNIVYGGSPSRNHAMPNRRRERTITTTIPVKGLSDSEAEDQLIATPKRGRGRPRKSAAATPVPAKNRGRAGTPTRKNSGSRKSIGDTVDGDDSQDVNFQIGKGVEIGRGKGRSRSRSRSTKGASRKSTPAAKQDNLSDKVASSTTSKRGRRKTLLPEEVVALENEDSGHNVEKDEVEVPGVLDVFHSNGVNPSSAYSTIRSTTTVAEDEPDITLAIFDPGNETPHRTGWSSPRIIEAPIPFSSRQKTDRYPSPAASPVKSQFSQHEEESIAMVPVPHSDRLESVETETYDDGDDGGYDGGQYEDENEDNIAELREFDTILESEGFSMISVDSVPSLREHHGSPANQTEKDCSRPVRNKSLLTVQKTEAAGKNDSFSSVPEEVLAAATPGGKVLNRQLLSVQSAVPDGSFSSILPEVLEAATPGRKTLVSKVLRNLGMEDSFSSIAPEILEAATPARALSKQDVSTSKAIANEPHEDSFSALPSAILDAATPAVARQPQPKPDKLSVPGTRLGVSPADATNPAALRLPTPEKTPSPPRGETNDHDSAPKPKPPSSRSVERDSTQNAGPDSSIVHSIMPSSPPSIAPHRYTYTAHLRQHRQLNQDVTQTPSIVFSSPSLPPIPPARAQQVLAPVPEQSQRPTLSPIVRAGRALQDVVVPSSPRSRSQSLGSPFKSPAADRRSSPNIDPQSRPSPLQERRAGPLPRLDLNGEISGLSSQRHQWPSLNQQEDPFSIHAPPQPTSSSSRVKQHYSLDLPEQRRYSDPRLSNIRSEVDCVRSEDAMSWQAEEEVSLPGGTTSISNLAMPVVSSRGSLLENGNTIHSAMRSEQRYAAEREEVRNQIASADASKVIVIDSDSDELQDGRDDEDEGFDLLLETLNSSSPAVQLPHEPINEAFGKPRRSKIPSPWRKNSKRLVYSDELSQLESHIADKVTNTKDLAKDLRPGRNSQPVTVRRIVTPVYSDETDPADMSGWHIPQKSNFKPRVRESHLDLSALLGSPEKPLPVLTTGSQQPYSQQDSSSSKMSSKHTRETSSEAMKATSGEVTGFTPIPQKMGFNPRARTELSSSPVKPTAFAPNIFGGPVQTNPTRLPVRRTPQPSSPVSPPLGSLSPSRTNSLPAHHTPSDQLSSSVRSEENLSSSLISNEDKENQQEQNRPFKWTESLRLQSATAITQIPLAATSPTKSCLRPPLKTPSANSGSENLSPSKAVAFVSSSPLPPSPIAAPLSSTDWSKDHWKLLDSIIQAWKPENQASPSASSSEEEESGSRSEKPRKRRNSTRVISRLLGKTVRSQGESMELQQWHLEVVDEFRGIVPGWEEKVIALRVFACLVGEERRALGLVHSSAE